MNFASLLRLACAGALLVSSGARAGGAPETSTVVANVGPLRATKGSLACRLYKSAEGFPLTTKGTINQRVKVTGAMVRCSFDKLPSGIYAVMVHHDENDNRKFDKNLLGMPLEGYGASNNVLPALSAPSWSDSKFAVEPGKKRELTINVRY